MMWSRSFSYQRKPRMSSLRPCRMPQTLAPVCELQSLCQEVSMWLPSASQRGERGHVAVADRPAHGVEAQPVDLQEDHAGRAVVGGAVGGAAPGPAEEQLVLVERQQAADQRGDRRPSRRRPPRRSEVGDDTPGTANEDAEHARAEQQEAARGRG